MDCLVCSLQLWEAAVKSKLSHINTACPHSVRLLQTSLLPWIIHWTCILLTWGSFFLFRFFFSRLFPVPHSLSHLSTFVTALLVEPEENDRSCVLWQWSVSNIRVHCSCKYAYSRGTVCLTELKTEIDHKVCIPPAKWEVTFLQVATSRWLILTSSWAI